MVEYRVPSPIALMVMVAALPLAWLWDKGEWTFYLLASASLALTAVSAVGVLVGSVVGDYVPLIWIKRAAAAAFILIGVLMLLGKF